MRVDLLLVLRLEDKNDLDGNKVVGVFALRNDQLWCSVYG